MTVAPRRSAPASPESRAAPTGPLSVAEIVETGLRMGVRDGFETLSMRTLARELNVSTMALYHHVPNKGGLMVLLVDAVLAGIPVPPPDYGDWTERLRELNERSNEVLSSFPGLDRVMFDIPPTPEGWRLMNGYVQILLDAGFPEREAALAFSVVHSYGLGRATMERELRRSRRPDDAPDLPALDQLSRHWASMHRPAARGFAMDVIVAGLRSMLDDCEAPDRPRRP
ncbi:TetR/AcrR family transcriptional regulator [Blastococcus sp. CT_GayMR16]|uniref:TetR/AcrR family transcriptional regulator n=1 Tax=Blastococcus sp. CT_GayMR16 TaxID=2559607 RepID=UPI001ADD852A|nr:TetR/AcrR family transcriptional regulator [Blastococcus sp. CT_GayMR16]